jgi:hypothetical protein
MPSHRLIFDHPLIPNTPMGLPPNEMFTSAQGSAGAWEWRAPAARRRRPRTQSHMVRLRVAGIEHEVAAEVGVEIVVGPPLPLLPRIVGSDGLLEYDTNMSISLVGLVRALRALGAALVTCH